MKSSGSGYIPTLDGWRAIAILLVLVDHTIFRTFRPYGWTLIGGHGVEIFFILSGYLITGKLLEDGSLQKFYTRRAFRILPILFAYLLAVSVLGFVLHRIPLLRSEIISSALFVRNYLAYPTATWSGFGWFSAHLWSLSIEEQFYLIWPLVLLKVGKGTPRRQALAAILFSASWTTVFVLVHIARLYHLGGWPWIPHLSYGGLVAGCLLRIAFSDTSAAAVINRVFTGRSAIAAALLFGYMALFHNRITIFDWFFCSLAVCATLVEPNAWVGRVLEFPILRWIGRLSYSLYIWQQLFLAFGETLRPFGFFSRFPINLASLLVVSCLSYYLLERPLMRLGHGLAIARQVAQTTPAMRLVA